MGAHEVADVSANVYAYYSSYATDIDAYTGTNAHADATTNNKDTNAAPNARTRFSSSHPDTNTNAVVQPDVTAYIFADSNAYITATFALAGVWCKCWDGTLRNSTGARNSKSAHECGHT